VTVASVTVGRKVDPLDHFTKPEWAAILRRAANGRKVRVLSSYTMRELLSILKAAEGQSDGR
jgi:hypothetical protein